MCWLIFVSIETKLDEGFYFGHMRAYFHFLSCGVMLFERGRGREEERERGGDYNVLIDYEGE